MNKTELKNIIKEVISEIGIEHDYNNQTKITDIKLLKSKYPSLIDLMIQFKNKYKDDISKGYKAFFLFMNKMKPKDFYEKYVKKDFHTTEFETPMGKQVNYHLDFPFMYYNIFAKL